MKKLTYHNKLLEVEVKKLEHLGFFVEREKQIAPHCRVDVFGKRDNEIVIIECGFCCRSTAKMRELRLMANQVVHVPYIFGRAYLSPWVTEEPWLEVHEKSHDQMDETHFDWKEFLKKEVRAELA